MQDAHDPFEAARSMLLRSNFWRPAYVETSAWLSHIPFAFWLVEAQTPRSIVELGTHYGASYFAFCQAVDRLNLDTVCHAIDTWKGDRHSGLYGEDVYAKVLEYNEANYSDFSKLLRATFDEALDHFQDNSIDVLHIDGLHTLEAVNHDFTTWQPKLSDEGVVVFHDTNVRERGFGVSKLFERLRTEYPVFEFSHGHGLGIVGVGKNQKPLLRQLFSADRNSEMRRSIREIFSRLGHTHTVELSVRKLERRVREAEAEVAKIRSLSSTTERQ